MPERGTQGEYYWEFDWVINDINIAPLYIWQQKQCPGVKPQITWKQTDFTFWLIPIENRSIVKATMKVKPY